MIRLVVLALLCAQPAGAETVLAAGVIRAKTVISATDLVLRGGDSPGVLNSVEEAIGMEARVTLYPGRPIRQTDIGPPAVIERNQIIPIVYDSGVLRIETEGRSLSRAGIGERVRVMNLNSKATVSGRVLADGTVIVTH